jgi:hypothetical protein
MSEVGADPSFNRNLMVLEHFRYQFAALSDKTTLELLRSFQGRPFMNAEARSILGRRRQATWSKLSALVQLGLVQKRGHVYRVSPFTKEFVSLAAGTLQALVTGERPPIVPGASEALRMALEGLELLYSKGKLKQEEYSRFSRVLEAMGNGGGA